MSYFFCGIIQGSLFLPSPVFYLVILPRSSFSPLTLLIRRRCSPPTPNITYLFLFNYHTSGPPFAFFFSPLPSPRGPLSPLTVTIRRRAIFSPPAHLTYVPQPIESPPLPPPSPRQDRLPGPTKNKNPPSFPFPSMKQLPPSNRGRLSLVTNSPLFFFFGIGGMRSPGERGFLFFIFEATN